MKTTVRFCPPLHFPNYVSNVGGSVVCKSFPCECLNMQNFVHEIETLHESMQGSRERGSEGMGGTGGGGQFLADQFTHRLRSLIWEV